MITCAAPAPTTFADAPSAAIRFVQASPDMQQVDIYVDAKPLDKPIAFGASTGYQAIGVGAHQVQIGPAGGDISTARSLDIQIKPNTIYTIVATGRQPELKLTAIAEQPSTPASGKAGMRVYHFSPDAPAIDLKRQIPDSQDTQLLVSNLAFPTASSYRDVDPGIYTLLVLPATVNLPIMGTLSELQMDAGVVYSIFIMNSLSKQSQVLVHFVRDTPPPLQPSRLPDTGAQYAAPTWLGLLACVLVACGAIVWRRVR